MDDSDSELLSDSDEDVDIVAQANKARAAASAKAPEPVAVEEQKEEEVVAAEEEDDAAAEAAAQEETDRLAAEAARLEEEAEAARLAEEEEKAIRLAEEKRKQEEEERAREEVERKEREETERKRLEEEERKRQEEERKKTVEAARQAEEAAAAEEEEEENDEEEVEGDDEEEVEAADAGPTERMRSKSTMQATHHLKLQELADKEHKDKIEAEANLRNFSKSVVHFKSEVDKRNDEERQRKAEEKETNAKKKADVRNTIEDGEKRLTEFKKMRKKGRKKKAWKPLIHGYVTIPNSSFKMKKGKKHKIDPDEGYYLALQLLPRSCNIDETEAEWTKNKKSDALVPSLVAFSSQDKYTKFTKKVGGKNMKIAAGLMPLAQFATGLCHLPDEFALGADVASAIATLKTDFVRSEAVLPVDSFRGGDSGEESQFVLVDRTQAFILCVDDEEQVSEWQEKLKSMQPEAAAE